MLLFAANNALTIGINLNFIYTDLKSHQGD